MPAPEFLDGIRMLRDQNEQGTTAYLFGRVKEGGWWYFFFAALLLKTPIAVLLLATLGEMVVLRRYWRSPENWEIAVPLAAFAMIMLASTPARLNSGVRYVLPVFVFLSILAAFGLATLWASDRHRMISRAAAIVLFTWLAVSSAASHPDYLSYFNEFGGRDPSHLIVVGDLDWGQDFTRLSTYLRNHSIKHISIAADTFFDPQPLELPETELVKCHGPKPIGWVAVELRRARLHSECYPWLDQQQAVATVGKTMTVYYVQ